MQGEQIRAMIKTMQIEDRKGRDARVSRAREAILAKYEVVPATGNLETIKEEETSALNLTLKVHPKASLVS